MNGLHAATVVRLTKDPELKRTKGGKAFLRINTMIIDYKASQDVAPEWLTLSVWGELAREHHGRLSKGDEAYVEGRLRLNTWQTNEGEHRSSLQLNVWKLEPMGKIGRRRPARQHEGLLA